MIRIPLISKFRWLNHNDLLTQNTVSDNLIVRNSMCLR